MKEKLLFIINLVSVLLLVAAVATAGYFYMQYKKATSTKTAAAQQQEVASLTSKVAKLIALPAGETPTLATVTDVQKLKDQQFFKNAANGDKVLIYQKSLKAYLYRPSENKIIEVGPVRLDQSGAVAGANTSTQTNSKQTPNEKVTMALYNGSQINGITASVEAQMKEKYPNVTVVSKSPAVRTDYQRTMVIDMKGSHSQLAKEIASYLKASVSSLPRNEATPSADMLIIVGNQ